MQRQSGSKEKAEYQDEKYVISDRINRASQLIPLDENIGNGSTSHVNRTF